MKQYIVSRDGKVSDLAKDKSGKTIAQLESEYDNLVVEAESPEEALKFAKETGFLSRQYPNQKRLKESNGTSYLRGKSTRPYLVSSTGKVDEYIPDIYPSQARIVKANKGKVFDARNKDEAFDYAVKSGYLKVHTADEILNKMNMEEATDVGSEILSKIQKSEMNSEDLGNALVELPSIRKIIKDCEFDYEAVEWIQVHPKDFIKDMVDVYENEKPMLRAVMTDLKKAGIVS